MLRSLLLQGSRHIRRSCFFTTVARSTTARVQTQQQRSFSNVRTSDGLWVDRALPKPFNKILIANRGEIACRVIRTCKQLGIRSVAIYSDADQHSQHVKMADEAYYIGKSPAKESYLLGSSIIDICKKHNVEAVHPGYGFLSENAGFAEECEQNGIIFIGPPASAINSMGSKSESKKLMTAANVPVVPGYHGENQNEDFLRQEAKKIGYPIMMKAVSGGGGKGMRIIYSDEEFSEKFESCRRESMNSFKDDRVLIEKYVQKPRHIEFQVFGDKFGNAVHFYERDCSVQRRHQKVLEEAPAPGMTDELRAAMGKAACDAAKAVGYVGAGTVEFIFDSETNQYYFMEMNTRLQVEHPVTEMIVQRDLVQLQLHVASGNPLPLTQKDVKSHGYAIEARVYAENPYNNFLPCTGRLTYYKTPSLEDPSIRLESHLTPKSEISVFYDPMISKLLAFGPSRIAAIDNLNRALKQYYIAGLDHNIFFIQKCLQNQEFRQGQVTTQFIGNNIAELLAQPSDADNHFFAITLFTTLFNEQQQASQQACSSEDFASPWHMPSMKRVNGTVARKVQLNRLSWQDNNLEEVPVKAEVLRNSDGSLDITIGASKLHITAEVKDNTVHAVVNQRAYNASYVRDGAEISLFVDGSQFRFRVPQVSFSSSGGSHGGCVAPMAGKIVKISAEAGQTVKKGQTLVIMEAMKMEHVIRAPADGKIDKVLYAPNDFVEGGKVVVTFAE